jgi:hypothetical protein
MANSISSESEVINPLSARRRLANRATLTCIGVSLVIVSCRGPQDVSSSQWISGDTLFVHNATPIVPDTLVPREVLRIGKRDGPPEYTFATIHAYTVSPAGHVYVQDVGSGVREFDRTGTFVRYLARRGRGPGEVSTINGITTSSDGRVAFHDVGNLSVSIYSNVGLLWTFKGPRGMPAYSEDALSFHDDGLLWLALNPPYPTSGGITHPRPVYSRVNTRDELVDTIWTPADLGRRCPALSAREFRAGFWEDRRDPFVPKAKWALGPDGVLALGCPADYRFDFVGPDGRQRVVTRVWEALRIPDDARTFFLSLGRVSEVPDRRPAYARIVVPGDGRIWVWPNQPVERSLVESELREASGVTYRWSVSSQGAFDVFGYDGVWLATVRLPSDARYSGFPTRPAILIRGDTLWALAVDEVDAEYLVRYEVDGLPQAGRYRW